MYDYISKYLSARLLEVDKEFKEHLDGFNFENIPSSKFNKSYFISPPTLNGTSINQGLTDDRINLTVRLFLKGFRDPKSAVSQGFDIANKFRLRSMRPEFLKVLTTAQKNIKHVIASVEIEDVNTNDNLVVCKIDFVIRAFYGTNDDLDC